MKTRLLSLFLCIIMVFSNLPLAAFAAKTTGMDIVYVDDQGKDTTQSSETGVKGSSDNPVQTLDKALSMVKEGGTIVIKEKLSILRTADDPLVIKKAVTLQGGILNLDHAGIVLGADVEFKEIGISLNNTVRNAIIANGYTLTLNSVKKAGSNSIKVFAGAITESQYPVPAAGNKGEVIVKGKDNEIADIYAGNLSDLGTNAEGENPTVDSHFSGDINIVIENGTTGKVGNIYGYGGRENREGTSATQGEMWQGIEDRFTVGGQLTIQTYGTVASNVFGASDKKAHVIYNSDSLITGMSFNRIKTLEVNGNLQPVSLGYGTNDKVNVILNSGGELDITQLMAPSEYTVKNFTGVSEGEPGILLLGLTDTLIIEENFTGKVQLQTDELRPVDKSTSGMVENQHEYVICEGTATGAEVLFIPYFSQASAVLNYGEGNWTAFLGEEEEGNSIKPLSFSIDTDSVKKTKEEINLTGATIPIFFDFGEEFAYGSEVPLNIEVSLGSQTYKGVSVYPEDEGFFVYCISALRMGMYVTGDGVDNILWIGKCTDHEDHQDMIEGTYRINIVVETKTGNVTESLTLKVGEEEEVTKTSLENGQLTLKDTISYIYDGQEKKPALSDLNLVVGDSTIALNEDDYEVTYENNIEAGSSAKVTVRAKENNDSYVGTVTDNFTINPCPLTIRWNNYTDRFYGDEKTVDAELEGVMNQDKVAVTLSGHEETEVGSHVATAEGLSGEKAKNYVLTGNVTQSYEIKKATFSEKIVIERNIRWNEIEDRSFELSDFTLPQNLKNGRLTAVEKEESTQDSQNIFEGPSVTPEGKVLISMNRPASYEQGSKGIFNVTIASDTHEDIIAKIIITILDKDVVDEKIQLSIENMVYGENPAPKGAFTGTFGNDVKEIYTYSNDGSTYVSLDELVNERNLLPAGEYQVRYLYTDEIQTGSKTSSFVVEKKSLTASFEAAQITKMYDGDVSVKEEQLPVIQLTGAIEGETPSIEEEQLAFVYEDKEAGENKVIHASGIALVSDNNINGNYKIEPSVSSRGGVITPAPVTVSPKTEYQKIYGEADPKLEYEAIGLVGEDRLEGSLTRNPGEEAGSYPYIVSGLENSNYKVELKEDSSTFVIGKAKAVLTLNADVTEQKPGGKILLTVSANSSSPLVAEGCVQPKEVVTQEVGYVKTGEGLFQGEYRIPEDAKAGDTIVLTVQVNDSNYEAEEQATVTILVTEDSDLEEEEPENQKPEGIWISNISDNPVYNGKKQTLKFLLYDGEVLLVEKKDYTVSYKNNTNAYLFEDNIQQELVVAGIQSTELPVAGSSLVEVEAGKEEQLTERDKKKAPQMIIRMKGNYQGSYKVYFQIQPIDLNDQSVEMDSLAAIYNGKVQKPVPNVWWKNQKLKFQKDFNVVEYGKSESEGELTGNSQTTTEVMLTIEGIGNFTGTRRIPFIIGNKEGDDGIQEIPANKLTVKGVTSKIWKNQGDTEGIKQENLQIKYKNDILDPEEYEIFYLNNKAVGTATILIKGTGIDTVDEDQLAYIGTKRITFKINGDNIGKVKIEGLESSYSYTGEEIRPLNTAKDQKIKVFIDSDGTRKELLQDVHYKVAYKNNINKGTATAILEGIGEEGYTGTKKITFKIIPDEIQTKGEELSQQYSVKITDEVASVEKDRVIMPFMKGGAKPEVEVKDPKGNILTAGKDYSVKYQKNTSITLEEEASVIITGKGNYSGSETIYFSVVPKDLSLPVSSDDITVQVKDLIEKTGKNGWKSSVKVVDQDKKALNKKDADLANIAYFIEELPSDIETYETKDELERLYREKINLTSVPKTFLPGGTKIKVVVAMRTKEEGGSGNYQGEAVGYYRILEKGYDIGKAQITLYPKNYTGREIEILHNSDFNESKTYLQISKGNRQPLLLEDQEGLKTNIEVVPGSYVKNVEKGTAKVTFRGKEGSGFGGTKTVTFKIKEKEVNESFWKITKNILSGLSSL